MRHHAFWALFSTFFFTAVGMYAISPQVVAYLIDAGFPAIAGGDRLGFQRCRAAVRDARRQHGSTA